MKKNIYLLIGSVLFFILFDQIIKAIYIDQIAPIQFGFLKFQFVPNYGFSFGSLTESAPLLRIVLASTLFGFIFMIFVGLIFFVWTKQELILLRLGLATIFSGIASNAIDRIRYGYAVDFLHIDLSFFKNYAFNIADLVQVIGLGLTIFSFFYLNQKIWHLNNLRTFNLINPRFQMAMALKLTTVGLCVYLLVWAFGHSMIIALLPPSETRTVATNIYDVGLFTILIIQSIILFLYGITFSQKIAGPIHALKIYVHELKEGTDREFKIRHDDYFPELMHMADEIKKLSKN